LNTIDGRRILWIMKSSESARDRCCAENRYRFGSAAVAFVVLAALTFRATAPVGLPDQLRDRAPSLGYADRDIATFGEILAHETSRATAPAAVAV
jgi:hypothetical protein